MNQPVSQPQYGENIAGRLFDVARQLQKNRERVTGFRRPTPVIDKVADGEKVIAALQANKQDEQKQDAARTPGALQKEGSQEGGRQRNVGQGEEESGSGQSSQVPGTKERQQGQRMR
jgi:hypothetical protein